MKIELKHVAKKFPDACPLVDVNCEIYDGDVISVIGSSGTGKSTLLRCINLMDPPTSGSICIDGLEITGNKENFDKFRRRIGMVFQSFNLFSHLTVVENVMLALTKVKGLSRQEAYDIAMDKLKMVGLTHTALKYPDELSGGQKQRVSIARTLAMEPELILFDEPTSALDPTMTREVESVISSLAQMGKTMMIVTHEMRLARAISNRVFYLDKGIIYEEGTPAEVFEAPKRERTRAFIDHLKVFKYKFNTGSFSYQDYQKNFRSFIDNNELKAETKIRLSEAVEAIFVNLIPKYMSENIPVSIICEHGGENGKLKILFYCFDKNGDVSTDFLRIMRDFVIDISAETIDDEDYNCKLSAELRV